MKNIKYFVFLGFVSLVGCKKIIELVPLSNLTTDSYYSNADQISTALTGCYNGLQKPMLDEWSLTELRSDNTVMGSGTGTTSSPNRDLSDLDMFFPSTAHSGVYNYWLNTYFNIRNINLVLNSLSANYNSTSGAISYDAINITISDSTRKVLASEASFLRAYHYFNLVRLYGGVFLVDKPITPVAAKLINRSSVADIYKLIIADLQNTITNGGKEKYASISAANLGRANSWCAKALLAKVYLNLNRKADAIVLLQDVIANSGYSLQTSYASVFSINNEMNSEMLFAVRYRAGGLGLGSPFPNMFAPLSSGLAVVNGSGSGLNYPAVELNTTYFTTTSVGQVKKDSVRVVLSAVNNKIFPGMFVSGTQLAAGTTVASINGNILTLSLAPTASSATAALTVGDARRPLSIGLYGNKMYALKMISNPAIAYDAENDWPVIRFADVLLMLAEAQGNSGSSLALINQTRARGGLPALTITNITTVAQFENALSTERRLEFAFENQRWFDLTRYNTTMTTITVEQRMKDHFASMYTAYYGTYPVPRLTLLDLQTNANTNRMLLPIPQREIDTNTGIVIAQNPGY